MTPVVRHPSAARGESVRLRRLCERVEQDRTRAVAMLASAKTTLETVCARCDAPELNAIAAEYGGFIRALEAVDPAQLADDLPERLRQIERRLMLGLLILEKYTAGRPA